jgi:NhaA family Na+:H+ antiporter
VAAALGGMIVPAVLYLAIAGRTAAHGWGVPMATDIALAVGVMALAGSSVPSSLRAFLLGLAVVDDIGAIVVIAVFYSTGVAFGWLAAAAGAVLAVVVLARVGVHNPLVFVTLGVALWLALHEAGVHPTLAGVAMGLLAPVTPRVAPELVDVDQLTDLSTVQEARLSSDIVRSSISTVEWLEFTLHPWTSYLIVPLFAFANAGIEVSTGSLRAAWGSPITWGIMVGLMAGKPLGVVLAAKLSVRAGIADPPEGTTDRQLLGAGNAAGIGFTVAIFIAELAFTDPGQIADAKLAILVASLLTGIIAFVVLRSRTSSTSAVTPGDAPS